LVVAVTVEDWVPHNRCGLAEMDADHGRKQKGEHVRTRVCFGMTVVRVLATGPMWGLTDVNGGMEVRAAG
jgi:hypothetical protein